MISSHYACEAKGIFFQISVHILTVGYYALKHLLHVN